MVAEVSELLKSQFLDNTEWHKSFANEANEVKKEDLEKFLRDTLINIINLFIESIIVGEYEQNLNIENTFNEIQKEVTSIYDSLVTELIEDPILLDSTQNFIKGVKVILSGYSNFFKLIMIHKSSPNYDVLFSSSPDNLAMLDESKFDDEIVGAIISFYSTLQLNRHDHFFDEGIEYFKDLIELENSINKNKYPFKHVSALNLKISFLKYKWAIRQKTTYQTMNMQSSVRSYLIDNNLFSVLDTPEYNNTNPRLNDWKLYLEYHYGYNGKDFYLKKYSELSQDLDSLNFYDLHFLIKYHKDIKPDYKNLSEIIAEIEKREGSYSSNKNLFYKNLNYALNNQFSLLINEDDVNETKVIELKDKIKTLQNKSSNDNFWVDYKYLQYRVKKFKNLIANRVAFDTEIPIKKHLKEIRELFSECERKINWSENHHNLLYQLPYEESLVTYNSETLEKIYFASSFLLPLSIEQNNYDFQKIKIDFINEFNHLEVFTSLNNEFNQIKSLKQNVENNDKKSIETITIFTAIISFIVGSISGFSFIDSFYKAIIFLLIFSTSLLSFLLLVFISTKGFEKIYKFKEIILFIYIGIAVILSSVFFFKEKNDELEEKKKKVSVEKQIKKHIDSLSKIHKAEVKELRSEINAIRASNKKIND